MTFLSGSGSGGGGSNQLGSRVATLVATHDLSWQPCRPPPAVTAQDGVRTARAAAVVAGAQQEFMRGCAAALRRTPPGRVAFYLGGEALLADGGALTTVAAIAAACGGAALLCENAFARVDRGAGLPHLKRLPYFPQEAARCVWTVCVLTCSCQPLNLCLLWVFCRVVVSQHAPPPRNSHIHTRAPNVLQGVVSILAAGYGGRQAAGCQLWLPVSAIAMRSLMRWSSLLMHLKH